MKISFLKSFSKEGFVYNQAVSVEKKDYVAFIDAMMDEVDDDYPNREKYINGNDMNIIYLTKGSLEGNKYYMRLTERRFFENMFNIRLKDRNTYLIIR